MLVTMSVSTLLPTEGLVPVVKSLVHNLPPRHRSSPCRLPQAGASGFDEVQGAVGSLDRVRYRRMRFLEHEADPAKFGR